MKLHIGKEIERRYKESGLKHSEFAKRLNTSTRNVYTIFERNEIKTDMLQKISEVLGFNFFSLYSSENNQLNEPRVNYQRQRTQEAITIMVELDGTESTLNQWIKRLTAINKNVSVR